MYLRRLRIARQSIPIFGDAATENAKMAGCERVARKADGGCRWPGGASTLHDLAYGNELLTYAASN